MRAALNFKVGFTVTRASCPDSTSPPRAPRRTAAA
jgi:hypothetical protein